MGSSDLAESDGYYDSSQVVRCTCWIFLKCWCYNPTGTVISKRILDLLMGSDSSKKKNHHPTISKYHRMLRKHQRSLQVGTVFREEVERGDWYCFGFQYIPWTSFFFQFVFFDAYVFPNLLKWIQVINTVDTTESCICFQISIAIFPSKKTPELNRRMSSYPAPPKKKIGFVP